MSNKNFFLTPKHLLFYDAAHEAFLVGRRYIDSANIVSIPPVKLYPLKVDQKRSIDSATRRYPVKCIGNLINLINIGFYMVFKST